MQKKRLGLAMCGSFCTFSRVLPLFGRLVEEGYDVVPIMSEFAYATDTRFGRAADFVKEIEETCGREVIHTIAQAEPIGPKGLLDVLAVAPCTGNTLGKLACGITDSAVTMAVKAHLRNGRPVVIAASTNDALGAAAKNIGLLLNQKNLYFVPMQQDDSRKKPQSVVADFDRLPETVECALRGVQVEPVLL